MRLKLISCELFTREICLTIANSPHTIDATFTTIGAHVHSRKLRQQIQDLINASTTAPTNYDAILLCYGLCGNATVGLQAPNIPLIIPRAHDCTTILLGSRAAFQEHFGNNPSRSFSSPGIWERQDQPTNQQLVTNYGADNAQFLNTAFPPESQPTIFIEPAELTHLGYAENFRRANAAKGLPTQIITSHLTIIKKLLNGDWDSDTFLVVPPGQQVAGVYDQEKVIKVVGST